MDSQIAGLLGGSSDFGSKELRWLMHWCRSELLNWFGVVHLMLGNEQNHKEDMIAMQADNLSLIKQVGEHWPLGLGIKAFALVDEVMRSCFLSMKLHW